MLDNWFDALAAVGIGLESTTVLTDDAGEKAWRRLTRVPRLRVDSAEYRGPAGVLRDASDEVEGEGPLIIIEHTRMLASPDALDQLVRSHFVGGQSITIATNPDGSFSGVLVAERAAIRIIPSIGFMDIKEQWIPAAQANGCEVRRVPLGCCCDAVRSLDTYLSALDRLRAFDDEPATPVIGRMGGDITPSEYGGALVDPTAVLGERVSAARSVICADAVIGDGAIVVRSVVGPSARVPNAGVVVDSVVRAADD